MNFDQVEIWRCCIKNCDRSPTICSHRRRALEVRVIRNHPSDGIKTAVAIACDADIAIIVWHVADQPPVTPVLSRQCSAKRQLVVCL